MNYWIYLKPTDPEGVPVVFEGTTPAAIGPQVFDAMVDQIVDGLGICRLCDVHGRRCHVIEEGTGRKFCPVLFWDVVRPEWKVENIA